MAAPVTDTERQAIVERLREGASCREIATDFGRSPSTISAIAQSIGHAFGQSNASKAHEARAAYSAERRAMTAEQAQERVDELLFEVMGTTVQEAVATMEGVELVERRPNPRDWRDWASAAQTLMRTVLDIDRHDNRHDEGLAAVDQWLRDMLAGAAG